MADPQSQRPDRDFDPAFGSTVDTEIAPVPISEEDAPTVEDWYGLRQIPGVPDSVAPFLSAHGFIPHFVGPNYLPTGQFAGWDMTMERDTFFQKDAIQDMIDLWRTTYNTGRDDNHRRYRDLVDHFDTLIKNTQLAIQDAYTELCYDVDAHTATLDALAKDYKVFWGASATSSYDATGFVAAIDALTIDMEAEREDARERFANLQTAEDQRFMNRGFASSGMLATVAAGITGELTKELLRIAEAEQRAKADLLLKQNEMYKSGLQMRQALIDLQMKLTDRVQEFLAYETDTRNKLALDLFKMVEGREDAYPGFGDLVGMVTSLSSGVGPDL